MWSHNFVAFLTDEQYNSNPKREDIVCETLDFNLQKEVMESFVKA